MSATALLRADVIGRAFPTCKHPQRFVKEGLSCLKMVADAENVRHCCFLSFYLQSLPKESALSQGNLELKPADLCALHALSIVLTFTPSPSSGLIFPVISSVVFCWTRIMRALCQNPLCIFWTHCRFGRPLRRGWEASETQTQDAETFLRGQELRAAFSLAEGANVGSWEARQQSWPLPGGFICSPAMARISLVFVRESEGSGSTSAWRVVPLPPLPSLSW